ncbi:outer membrane beta-barrel protein [Mucilaginibacter sp. Bleaf8]|uniref:outer membrane beta-barrel protein n=1 Tax=Mucilaginibacter sp. Bleaf8 TaxID=2834430 RepID=UPI001BCAD081|nr:outer membrane beta-barrel protein [Mucilaginibacter sp. Bleaf8]MBS7565450.1 outer membrane beta-barrel protein [Mucilaginibacter sp. Bleaf8]
MKRFLLFLTVFITAVTCSYAQTARSVTGIVIDSTKQTLVGSTVKLSTEQNETANTIADANGRFTFQNIKGNNVTLTITSIGYQGIIKHYTLAADGKPANVGVIVLKTEATQLNAVTIVGAPNPVSIKEDTVQYNVAALNLRANSTLEDALKKSPGIDVDPSTGAVTAQGQQVTKVRINGKDYMGGDVTSLTRNLPADLAENIQIVDDYGDQANLTGIKTGEPQKVLNITIRKDKNYGYSLQTTGGGGSDLLPKNQDNNSSFLQPQKDQGRYFGSLNLFKFKGDQQISVMGNLNNTNLNTFAFGGGGGAGGNFGGGGGGGGRGNAARSAGGTTSNQNGITNARSIGGNYRDQWGKNLSAYGSYSFADNNTYTTSNIIQNNFSLNNNTTQNSVQNDNNINHRFNFNLEYKPDTLNYLKVTPTFTYNKSLTTSNEDVSQIFSRDSSRNQAYTSRTYANSSSPTAGLTALYNHRFNGRGRNLSVNVTANTSKNDQSQNPVYVFTQGTPNVPLNQQININSKTNSIGSTFSYIEPLSRVTFLELNYAYNRSYTSSNKVTDSIPNGSSNYVFSPELSNNFDFTFTTHRAGLSVRVVKPKYNYTLGVGVQPAILNGHNGNIRPTPIIINNTTITPTDTRQSTVNFAPTARFVYNFSRSQTFSANYNGNNNQPSFSQLQPVLDRSNAFYPTVGNPFLKPEFQNNFSIRYNKFSFQTGDLIFTNLSFTQTNNKIVTKLVDVPKGGNLKTNPFYSQIQGSNLATYQNADGYYSGSGMVTYAKPWKNRRYTLYLRGMVNYTNNIGYLGAVDSITAIETVQKNIAKNWQFTPEIRFRTDITDIIDAQAGVSYAVNRTNNSLQDNRAQANSNFRTLALTFTGKNYLWKNWTISYDYYRNVFYGYDVDVTNPNILNGYVERRFLKNNAATIRAAVFDVFNENRGYTVTNSGTSTTQSSVNRLGRYFLLTFTFRLQKFAGRAPMQQGEGEGGGRRFRNGGGQGGPGGGGPGAGPSGPGIM